MLGRPGYLRRDLLGVAGYRKRLGVLLDDTTILGTITIREANNRQTSEIRWKDQEPRANAVARPDPSAPRTVSETSFRACDYLAWQLSTHGIGIVQPRFHLEWPQERRDEALAAAREALKRLDQ